MLSKLATSITSMLSLSATNEPTIPAKKCPFGFSSGSTNLQGPPSEFNALYPSEVLTCSKTGKVLQTQQFSGDQYEELALQIIAQQYASENKGTYAACLLRLEGHDLMDFRRERTKMDPSKIKRGGGGTGGSDGCVNFKDSDNAGLQACLMKTNI